MKAFDIIANEILQVLGPRKYGRFLGTTTNTTIYPPPPQWGSTLLDFSRFEMASSTSTKSVKDLYRVRAWFGGAVLTLALTLGVGIGVKKAFPDWQIGLPPLPFIGSRGTSSKSDDKGGPGVDEIQVGKGNGKQLADIIAERKTKSHPFGAPRPPLKGSTSHRDKPDSDTDSIPIPNAPGATDHWFYRLWEHSGIVHTGNEEMKEMEDEIIEQMLDSDER